MDSTCMPLYGHKSGCLQSRSSSSLIGQFACKWSRERSVAIYGLGSLVPRPREEKGLVYIEHFLGLADSAVLISDVPIRTLPCDMLSNNHVTWCC